MRAVFSISLLVLLLYHTGRVGVVLLYFNQYYPASSPIMQDDEWVMVKMPISLPYTTSWQNQSGQEGLIRVEDQFYNVTDQMYQNDTLYTVLKTNITARERFFALADEIKQSLDLETTKTNSQKNLLAQVIRLLNQLGKVYVPFSVGHLLQQRPLSLITYSHKTQYSLFFSSLVLPVLTPPPEDSYNS